MDRHWQRADTPRVFPPISPCSCPRQRSDWTPPPSASAGSHCTALCNTHANIHTYTRMDTLGHIHTYTRTDTHFHFHLPTANNKVAVIVYRAVHGTAPRQLSDLLHCVVDITSRCRLRSSTSSELVIPLSRLVTVGDRSFAVAGPRLWNTLPEDITSAPSLLAFQRKLKMHLFP